MGNCADIAYDTGYGTHVTLSTHIALHTVDDVNAFVRLTNTVTMRLCGLTSIYWPSLT